MKLKFKIVLFWFFVLLTQQSKSQSYIDTFSAIIKNKSFTEVEFKIDSLINHAISNDKHLESAKLCDTIFLHLYRLERNYKKAIKYGLIEVNNYKTINVLEEKYNKILYNLGWAHYRIQDFNTAILYHKKVIALNNDEQKIAQAYCEIGRNYSKLGDFYKAEEYYLKGINLLETQKNYNALIGKYFGLVHVYVNINTKKSLNKQLLTLQKVEPLNLSSRQRRSLNNYYANYYSNPKTFNFEKAKPYFLRNLELSIKAKDSAFICGSYTNLGDIYNEAKHDSALYFIKKGNAYCKRKEDRSIVYHQVSKSHVVKNDFNKALIFIDKSIEELIKVDPETGIPLVTAFEEVIDKFNLLLAFDQKAEIFLTLFQKDGNKTHVKKALEQFTLIDTFIDVIEGNASEEQSQLHWRKEASKTYSKAIACANILERPDLAFYFNEKSKALLLTEDILKNALAVSLPESIIKKEATFKKSILKLESELKTAKNPILKDSVFDLKFEYQKFTDSLKVSFPEYYNNKSKTQLYSLNDVKEQLDNNTIVISYNWDTSEDNNDMIHGLAFTKGMTKSFRIEQASKLNKTIGAYRTLLSRPHDTQKDSDDFKNVAYNLFKTLFPEAIAEELKNKHVLIIPDGSLQNIPFEAFITSPNSTDYFIKSNEISYAYSMSFLRHNQSVSRKTTNNFVGFAPVSFNDQTLSKLKQSDIELNSIYDIIGGEKYLNTDANKSAFLSKSSGSKIIHLATHAEASSNPWIALSDEAVKLHELYTHKTNADLVVLSACNTSLGEQAQGEGVFSLARGFFYSGANSVISTHWSINDNATSVIIQDFYSNLKGGETKSEALRKAQLSYINNNELSLASPYYWAPFALVGDYNNAVLSNTTSYYIVLLIALLFFISIFIFLKKKKK